MYDKILVPIDGNDTATLGLREALKLAHSLGGRIRLLHVVYELPVVSAPDGDAGGVVLAGLRSAGVSILEEAAAAARDAGVRADTKLLEELGGQAGTHIVQEAQTWPADLIVCGTHGRRGIRRAVMGSAAEYIARHSSVPVVLVPSRVPPLRGAGTRSP
jgi:nucleotide-binding universal stress UspA family protein